MCTINQSTGQICFPFIAKRPARDLQIMVCSCAMSPNCVWLQITFCFCVNETTLFSFLQGCPPCGIVCQNLFYSIVYHSELIVVFLCFLYYNSTSIEIMSRSLRVRYHLAMTITLAGNPPGNFSGKTILTGSAFSVENSCSRRSKHVKHHSYLMCSEANFLLGEHKIAIKRTSVTLSLSQANQYMSYTF